MSTEVQDALRQLAIRVTLAHDIMVEKAKGCGGEEVLEAHLKEDYKKMDTLIHEIFAYLKKETGSEAGAISGLANVLFAGVKLQDVEDYNGKLDARFKVLLAETAKYDDAEVKALKIPADRAPLGVVVAGDDNAVQERVKHLAERVRATMIALNIKLQNKAAQDHPVLGKIVVLIEKLVGQIAAYLRQITGEEQSTLGRFKHMAFSDDIKEKLDDYDQKLNHYSQLWNLEVSHWSAPTVAQQAVSSVTGVLGAVAGLASSAVGAVAGAASATASAVGGAAYTAGSATAGAATATVSALSAPFQSAFSYFGGLTGAAPAPAPAHGAPAAAAARGQPGAAPKAAAAAAHPAPAAPKAAPAPAAHVAPAHAPHK